MSTRSGIKFMHGRQMKSSHTNHLSESKHALLNKPEKLHQVAQLKQKSKQQENLHQIQVKSVAAQKKAVKEIIEKQ